MGCRVYFFFAISATFPSLSKEGSPFASPPSVVYIAKRISETDRAHRCTGHAIACSACPFNTVSFCISGLQSTRLHLVHNCPGYVQPVSWRTVSLLIRARRAADVPSHLVDALKTHPRARRARVRRTTHPKTIETVRRLSFTGIYITNVKCTRVSRAGNLRSRDGTHDEIILSDIRIFGIINFKLGNLVILLWIFISYPPIIIFYNLFENEFPSFFTVLKIFSSRLSSITSLSCHNLP